MNKAAISSGDELDSYCGKCKQERVHNVVALVDGAVAHVMCKTCGSRHRHRQTPSAPQKRVRAARKSLPAGPDRGAKLLEKAMASDADRKPYSGRGVFAPGDFLEHPLFGPGVVLDATAAGRMHVLFQGGPRRLVFGRVPPPVTES